MKDKARDAALQAFEPFTAPPLDETADVAGLHEDLKGKIAEMGRIQKFLAEVEYPMEETRLDVVWRRVEKSVPTYVFEIQVGGDIYHALAKLKHAYDLWNSRIFLVAAPADVKKADSLLSGTFHEIRGQASVLLKLRRCRSCTPRKKPIESWKRPSGFFDVSVHSAISKRRRAFP